MRKSKSESRFPSLRAKMFLSFGLFCVIVLAVLWLFQTVLLDDVYKTLKLYELEKCADQVYHAVMQSPSYDDFDEAAGELAKEYAVCLSIYDIREHGRQKSGTCVMEKHVNSFCFIALCFEQTSCLTRRGTRFGRHIYVLPTLSAQFVQSVLFCYSPFLYLRFDLSDKSPYTGVAKPNPPETVSICPVV